LRFVNVLGVSVIRNWAVGVRDRNAAAAVLNRNSIVLDVCTYPVVKGSTAEGAS
jgi:hypothetical protein